MFDSIPWPTLPPVEVMLGCAVAAVSAALVLAACFSPFMAVAGERLSIVRGRGFYAKAAHQVAQMSLFLGLLAAGALFACVMWLAADEPALFLFPYRLPLQVAGGSILCTLALLWLYVAVRPRKGPSTFLHTYVGLIAGIFALLSLLLWVSMTRRLLQTIPDINPDILWHEQLLIFFTIPPESLFWPLLLESIPLGFAFAGAFASVWLLIVRQRQDFGRDYYSFALPYCLKWSLFATLAALPCGVYVFFRGREEMLPQLTRLPSTLLDTLSVALPLMACILWLRIIKSDHPMRHKISTVVAWLLLLCGFAGQVLMLNKIIPSP